MSKKKARGITQRLTSGELKMLAKIIEEEIKKKEKAEAKKLRDSLSGGCGCKH